MPSTIIRSFDYDPQRALLIVRFVSGSVYQYFDVPEQLFADMKNFREKGIFYNQHIKGKFRFERIEP